jgi:hypothetical protein
MLVFESILHLDMLGFGSTNSAFARVCFGKDSAFRRVGFGLGKYSTKGTKGLGSLL